MKLSKVPLQMITLLFLSLTISACGGGGGGNGNGGGENADNNWDQMPWDQGTWN